jgi:DedD protein
MARPAPTAAKTTRATEEAPTRREPVPAARPGTPPPAAGDYVVQLGVFTNPGNAQELVERLKKQGIRAYTETRVQVGPFKNKAEAEKAQVELKRIGISGLLGTTK